MFGTSACSCRTSQTHRRRNPTRDGRDLNIPIIRPAGSHRSERVCRERASTLSFISAELADGTRSLSHPRRLHRARLPQLPARFDSSGAGLPLLGGAQLLKPNRAHRRPTLRHRSGHVPYGPVRQSQPLGPTAKAACTSQTVSLLIFLETANSSIPTRTSAQDVSGGVRVPCIGHTKQPGRADQFPDAFAPTCLSRGPATLTLRLQDLDNGQLHSDVC